MPFKIGEDQPVTSDPNKSRFLFRSGDNIFLTEEADGVLLYAWHPGLGDNDKKCWVHVDEEHRLELALAILPRDSVYGRVLIQIVHQIRLDVNREMDLRFGSHGK